MTRERKNKREGWCAVEGTGHFVNGIGPLIITVCMLLFFGAM